MADTETERMIADCDKWHREANMSAARSTGWHKRVHLWFAGLYGWLGDWGRDIVRDEKRGKDDSYHDEY